MPRSMWNGSIAFGSVTVPIKVYAATEAHSLKMREIHTVDGAPLAHQRFDPDSDDPVPADRIARGVEVKPGEWVLLSKEELASVDTPRRRAIEIEAFVPDDQLDPVYYDRAYNLAPQQDGVEGYTVLLAALQQTGRLGIGRVVFRSRERLAAIRAGNRSLLMHTLLFHDQLIPGASIRLQKAQRQPTKQEIEMATALIDTLSGKFEDRPLQDTYRDQVFALARQKAHGKRPKPKKAPKPSDTGDTDLLDALQASIAAAK